MTRLLDRRRTGSALVAMLVMQFAFHVTFMAQPSDAHLDFWTKIKILALLKMVKKISVVPIPLPVPIPIHLESHDEIVLMKPRPMHGYNRHASIAPPKGPSYAASAPVVSHEIAASGMGGGGGYGGGDGNNMNHMNNNNMNNNNNNNNNNMNDHEAYASEATEIIASPSFKYGERIRPGAAPSVREPRPVVVNAAPRPVLRNRTFRNRARPNVAAPVTETPYQPAEHFPPTTADPIAVEYNALNPSNSRDPNVKIALIHMKPSEIADIANTANESESAYKPDPEFSEELSKNLLNYLREVNTDSNSDSQSNTPSKEAVVKITDVIKPNSESYGQPQPQRFTVPVISYNNPVQTAPMSSGSMELGPIASQWSNQLSSNLQNNGYQNSGQYIPQDYTPYRQPELKVITTRYNPKAAMEEQARFAQAASRPIQPYSNTNSNGATVSSTPEKSQFLYSVTHDYQNPSSIQNPLFGSASRPSNGYFNGFSQPTPYSSRPFAGGFIDPLSSSASIPRGSWSAPKHSTKQRFLNRLNIF